MKEMKIDWDTVCAMMLILSGLALMAFNSWDHYPSCQLLGPCDPAMVNGFIAMFFIGGLVISVGMILLALTNPSGGKRLFSSRQ